MYGDGRQTRCFCHVSDVVAALVRLGGVGGGGLDEPVGGGDVGSGEPIGNDHSGRVFNLGSDEEISIADLARRVAKGLDQDRPVIGDGAGDA